MKIPILFASLTLLEFSFGILAFVKAETIFHEIVGILFLGLGTLSLIGGAASLLLGRLLKFMEEEKEERLLKQLRQHRRKFNE